jgi:hypothetical protein
MGIINTNTRRANDGQSVRSVSSLIQRYESMPMNGRSYGPQNRIQRSERDGGHKVRALIHKFESLAQDQSPKIVIPRRIRESERNYGQRIGLLIQLYESMPMRGRAYGPQNRILSSERDGGHKVKALIHKFENLAQDQSPKIVIPRRIRESERNYGQRIGLLIQLYESMPMRGRAYGPQNRILSSERDGGHKVRALIHKFENLALNYGQRVSGLRQPLDQMNSRQTSVGLQNQIPSQSTDYRQRARALSQTHGGRSSTSTSPFQSQLGLLCLVLFLGTHQTNTQSNDDLQLD